ncbi:DnaJ domain-containing protein [Halomicroarcula sp. F13]|uniref:DnaJ domain-containing protein n=1 Tax=Haloarcula rubra TaxID=2487747 RepID=A0AAW4PQ48_9EURY|nr:DnaJ domain-containing protein [Halomicroarcula rubra]MBX0323351.1 DnaJ domain-containing protein [Halomicroarcula rubra]
MTETFYDVLGVAADATTEEIEAAYRERLKETHPDVSDAADAREVTQTIVEARDVLVDEAARERYDRLGHEAFVGRESSVTESDVAAAARRAGYGESAASRTTSAGDTSAESDDGDPHQRARERAERERRASERVRADREDRTGTTHGDGTAAGDGRTRRTDSGRSAGRTAETDARGGYADAGGADAWTGTDTYAVRDSVQTGSRYERLVPTGRELTLLGITFALYPVLLFSALVPAFPLFVNLVLGLCLVLVVGYLQSVPNVAMLVFGAWSLVTPLVLVALNVSFLSLLGVVALSGTWLPFGFSILTYSVLRL